MSQPIVGIVSSNELIEKGTYKKPVQDVNDDYLNMIYKYGGVPIIIPNTNSFVSLKSFIDKMDALLLIGGEDVSDRCYSGKKSENPRDNFEIEIYKYFSNFFSFEYVLLYSSFHQFGFLIISILSDVVPEVVAYSYSIPSFISKLCGKLDTISFFVKYLPI